ncbi:MAG: DHA2 family efflux MFS transporter permease subunit [Pseudomonadales bacterium]
MTSQSNPRHALMMASIMLATVIYSLDSTIAAVVLPHMQGSFSATQEQVAWVLTSYIVSSAIMTPVAGFLADRFGRRRMFLLIVSGFVLASMACGLSTSLEEMVLFRILQGAFGAPLIPLAQASILDAYTPSTYGRGMALFGAGVMLGPIIGPTLGGWLTELSSWRWVFFINLPVGLIALLGIQLSVRDGASENRKRRFDVTGFALLSLAIGLLQLMLDRGNSLSWFESTEIQMEALGSALCFYLFVAHTMTTSRPFIDPGMFRDRNFTLSLFLSFAIGLNLMATMALMPPFLQNLLGYPVMTTGWILAPRGVGTMISMMLVGRLVSIMDPRLLILGGLALMAASLGIMSTFDHNVTAGMLMYTGTIQGLGMGFMFVPMSTMAFSTLDPRYRADGSALYSLGRNIGSSIGVSVLMGALAVYVRESRAHLVTHVTPFADALRDPALAGRLNPASPENLELLSQIVQREALMIGYLEDFRLMILITVLAMPLVFILRAPTRHHPG